MKRTLELTELDPAKKVRTNEPCFCEVCNQEDCICETPVVCDICEGTFLHKDTDSLVTGIGCVWSRDYDYPQETAQRLRVCLDCCDGHGDIDECAVCNSYVIGQTIDRKCRLCFSDKDIVALLEKHNMLSAAKDAWTEYSDYEWTEEYEKEVFWYEIFFTDDGEAASPAMPYLDLALWLEVPAEEREATPNCKEMLAFVTNLMKDVAETLRKKKMISRAKRIWSDEWDDDYKDENNWHRIFLEEDTSRAAEAMKYAELARWLKLKPEQRKKARNTDKMTKLANSLRSKNKK